ncbi:hypothetical protein J8M97_20615 [Gordonia polyisoprenivorans]|uniref:hypothetical protein n=1 Tax=Gordonia polyisoprenivorans TaxID=84595 RepID=UPI000B99E570|nr:hypothetical protein [Gordonia polyisoprenivorans]OZC33652.1 hypothetical protein CJJ17_20755 [Gordonia polyisoprenivorans]QUD82112.1 hypothetical protein J8M97_20615 [Gordonia polyisoprenivorans]WCB38149.1 hypothetical protein PHA63_03055 [Gordonia polyisoprenivorans]
MPVRKAIVGNAYSTHGGIIMIVIVGAIILLAAVIVIIASVATNSGTTHTLAPDSFSVLGYHITGSTGTLLLYGVVLGAIAMLGIATVLVGARRSSRRGHAARRDLKHSRQEAKKLSHARDDMVTDQTIDPPTRSREGRPS